MASTFRYPSATDGFNPQASGFVIGYIRRPSQFPLNRYVQLVEAKAPTFFYYKLDRDQMVRQHAINEAVWKDGADRPRRRDNLIPFNETQAFTVRYDWNTVLGLQTISAADSSLKLKQTHLMMLSAQAMLARTYNVVTLLDTAANWPSTNIADANTLNNGAGYWHTASDDPTDANYNAIRKSIMKAVTVIFAQTNGTVSWRDLKLIVNPDTARLMANSPELHNYIRQTESAVEKIEDDEEDYNERFGLPRRLYGLEVVIENTMYVNDLPTASATTASTNRTFIKSPYNAIIASRPGKLDAPAGPSFSTAQLYWYEYQMAVEEFTDARDKRVDLHVTDQHVAVGPAFESGYNITNVMPANVI